MSMDILAVAKRFSIDGTPRSYHELIEGHINNTYVVETTSAKYVLQRINTYVFKKPDEVMNNIFGVTEFLKSIIEKEGGDSERGTLHFIRCRDGEKLYLDDDGAWRMYHLVEGVRTYAIAETTQLFEKAGYAFGEFQRRLAGYDASTLHETIPGFHNTKARFGRFLEVLDACTSERKEIAAPEIEFVLAHKNECALIVDEIEAGNIPLRVTHNDTKLNNILIDEVTGDSICIIDLDTVMPGSALYDFGDSIRFGASSALEDEKDLDRVFFRNDMFDAYAKGYIEGTGGALTDHEIELFPMGALVITLETGMRFLTDYLENDVYFKTAYPDHNLVRARNQFKLVSDIETRMDEFKAIIKKYTK